MNQSKLLMAPYNHLFNPTMTKNTLSSFWPARKHKKSMRSPSKISSEKNIKMCLDILLPQSTRKESLGNAQEKGQTLRGQSKKLESKYSTDIVFRTKM